MFGIFLPAVIVPYAFTDDYSSCGWRSAGSRAPRGSEHPRLGCARRPPIRRASHRIGLPVAGTIDNLRFVRLVAVVGIVVLALLLHALVRSGIRPIARSAHRGLVCSLPAFQVYGSWAVLFFAPYAAILAAALLCFAVAAVDGRRESSAAIAWWARPRCCSRRC